MKDPNLPTFSAEELEKTIAFSRNGVADPERAAAELEEATANYTGMHALLTVFAGQRLPYIIDLKAFRKNTLTVGSLDGEKADIAIVSSLLSPKHAKLSARRHGWSISDGKNTLGTYVNGIRISHADLKDGDMIRIDNPDSPDPASVVIVYSTTEKESHWQKYLFSEAGKQIITVGRSDDNDIVLDHIGISSHHAKFAKEPDGWYVYDSNSTNGLLLNGNAVHKKARLAEKDVLTVSNTRMIFTQTGIYYCTSVKGLRLEAIDIVKEVKDRFHRKTINNHISLEINPGELVAIIGTSGSGKTTFLNCISGYNRATRGKVLLNNEDLYKNYSVMKNLLGYVPQQDIVYDNLTLYDMLMFSAKLRMPKDTTRRERIKRVKEVIDLVELQGKERLLIRKMSGGQKKRASIAVELISDPKIFFLDEPTSGLDPETEEQLMRTLRHMTSMGRTVVLVTHSTLSLNQCDKVIFIGSGGNLCYCGKPSEILSFFGSETYPEIYAKANAEPLKWADLYTSTRTKAKIHTKREDKEKLKIRKPEKISIFRQTRILCARYLKLILNDRLRTFLLIAMAPFLCLLISLVKRYDLYLEGASYSNTKSILLVYSCCVFWMGVFNSIQEICKERNIIQREHINGLKLTAYVLSKLIVLGILGAAQSGLFMLVYDRKIGLPVEGVILPVWSEMYLSTFLLLLTATAMGILVSSFFANPDRALTAAPLMIVPQVLFTGILFPLEGISQTISQIVACRWSVEAFSITCNMQAVMPTWDAHLTDTYVRTAEHLLSVWGTMGILIAACLILSVFVLKFKYKK